MKYRNLSNAATGTEAEPLKEKAGKLLKKIMTHINHKVDKNLGVTMDVINEVFHLSPKYSERIRVLLVEQSKLNKVRIIKKQTQNRTSRKNVFLPALSGKELRELQKSNEEAREQKELELERKHAEKLGRKDDIEYKSED